MTNETKLNKQVVRRLFDDIWNRGDMDVAREILAHPASVQHYVAEFRAAFPDVHHSVRQMIAEGDAVAVSWSASGTHSGEWLGLSATGKMVAWTGITLAHLVNGLIIDHDTHWDMLGFAVQLDTVPANAWLPLRS
jgi:predicted ester cyclase